MIAIRRNQHNSAADMCSDHTKICIPSCTTVLNKAYVETDP